MRFLADLRVAFRSLVREKGLAITVILTLGLGNRRECCGVQRGPWRPAPPLVNRDEDRLIYIRQSAPGIGVDNYTFSSRKSTTSSSAQPPSPPSAISPPSTLR
jgi:hypothetical protein